jgi:hypothetical protein
MVAGPQGLRQLSSASGKRHYRSWQDAEAEICVNKGLHLQTVACILRNSPCKGGRFEFSANRTPTPRGQPSDRVRISTVPLPVIVSRSLLSLRGDAGANNPVFASRKGGGEGGRHQ